jgi:hypothetical protein
VGYRKSELAVYVTISLTCLLRNLSRLHRSAMSCRACRIIIDTSRKGNYYEHALTTSTTNKCQVQRSDGSKVKIVQEKSFAAEMRALITAFKRRDILLLLPVFWAAYFNQYSGSKYKLDTVCYNG